MIYIYIYSFSRRFFCIAKTLIGCLKLIHMTTSLKYENFNVLLYYLFNYILFINVKFYF